VERSASPEHDAGLGFACLLPKPVRQRRLYECIARAMGAAAHNERYAEQPAGVPREASPLQARVLLAEDNPINQYVATTMLEVFGCWVRLARNGREAVQTAAQESFDLILMDCLMPEMDGFEATQSLRQREQGGHRHIPIVALTANAMEGDRERCLEVGMDDFLSKPFKQEELRTVLERWLDSKKLPDLSPEAEIPSTAEPLSPASEEAPSQPPALDAKTLAQLQGLPGEGAPTLLAELAGLYRENAAELLGRLRASVARGDTEGTRRAAHSLKSSSGNVGALQLSALCQSMETQARQGSLRNAPALFAQIEAEYERVHGALQRYRETSKGEA
jgi:two-component system sensor histidine kinase/response regulator